MLVGEAPGRTEDRAGVPFVGDAGQLFDEMLREVGLERDDVYVANVVKHRPMAVGSPRNRTPRAREIEACVPWLHEQIRLVRPVLIVPLGNVALRRFLGPKSKITEERGKLFTWEGRSVIPTYHPAYVMRFTGLLGEYRIDFSTIRARLHALSIAHPCRRSGGARRRSTS
jgi:DNA polymerase